MTLNFNSRLKFGLLALVASLAPIGSAFYPTIAPATPIASSVQLAQVSPATPFLKEGFKQLYRKNFPAAVQAYQQAIKLTQQENEAGDLENARLGLAKAYLLLEQYPQAVEVLEQVTPQLGKGFGGAAYSNLGLAYFKLGKFAEAEKALRRAIDNWTFIRSLQENDDDNKVTLFEQQAYTYRLLQKVLVAQKRFNEALELAEWSRSRALVELLAQRTTNSAFESQAVPQLAEIQQIARSHKTTLVIYSIVGEEMRVLGHELDTQTDLFIWVVSPTGAVQFRRVDLTTASQGLDNLNRSIYLETLVRDSRDSIGVPSRGISFQEDARTVARFSGPEMVKIPQFQRLHQVLIQPIADLLPQNPNDRVTFVPQGPLFLVPFAALQDRSGQYLIQKHTILTTPSVQLLALTRKQRNQRSGKGQVLVVGNPVMPKIKPDPKSEPRPLISLPGAEKEARAIAPILKTEPLIGAAATKAAVLKLLPQSRIIHLATHGILDLDPNLNEFGTPTVAADAPTSAEQNVFVEPGGVVFGANVLIGGRPANVVLARERVSRIELPGLIALSPSKGDDGFLSAKELIKMKLTAELVVLSACNTGRGRVTGDGVIGLSRALIGAGVPSVVVSLWAVPDAQTATLMTEFYRQLVGRADKAQALRQAMLAALKQYPDPRDWAAFTLIGEPE